MTAMFSMSFTSPWMEGSSNYVLTVVFFWHAICFSSMRVLPVREIRRSSAVLFLVISRVVSSFRTCTMTPYL